MEKFIVIESRNDTLCSYANIVQHLMRSFRPFLRQILLFVMLVAAFMQSQIYVASASSLSKSPLVVFDNSARSFQLDASALAITDDGVGAIEYLWIVTANPAGSTPVLSASTAPRTSLSADIDGDYTVELQLIVEGQSQAPIIFTASTNNNMPVSDARIVGGATPITLGSPVNLSAVASFDVDGNRLSYQWSVLSAPVGSVAAPSSSDSARVEFVPDIAGVYSISLSVTDELGLTAVDVVEFTTGAGVLTVDSGADLSGVVGEPILFDAFGSTLTTGAEVTPSWSVISAPSTSIANIVDGRDLSTSQPGRVSFTPDVAGDYVLNVAALGDGQTSYDRVIVSVGQGANSAPIANAGADIFIAAGDAVTLNGIASTDIDGDLLSYQWSIVSSPADSFATIVDDNAPRAGFIADIAGDYVVQLAVSDGQSTAWDTVLISTNNVGPLASAGFDSVLANDFIASLDGSASTSEPTTSYMWSLLGLTGNNAANSGQIANPLAQTTSVDLGDSDNNATTSPAQALEDYNLVVFKNSNSRSQVYGRALVGGNLNGQSSDYANQLQNAFGTDVLTVVGNINGHSKNINNGGNVRLGGNANAHINLNGGGQIISDPSVSVSAIEASIKSFSTSLKNLSPTGTVSIPTGQPGPVNIVAVPADNGVAVINISSGNTLFNNNKVQQIDINLNGASALVVNVGGNNVKLWKANFVGNANSSDVSSKVIWNFHSAKNIQTQRHLSGSLLAPNAHLKNQSPIYGSVAVKSILHRAAIAMPGFSAADAFGAAPQPLDSVVAQIKVSEGGFDQFDTVLITNAAIAPIAQISTASTNVEVGQNIALSGGNSSDANGEPITYQWSLIAKPETSLSQITGTGVNVALVPDVRGTYIAQLIVSDGILDSKPATFVIDAANQQPQITSSPIELGKVSEAYTYQLEGVDSDGDSLSWSLIAAPSGMTIDSATGLISWVPDVAETVTVIARADDGFGGNDEQTFSIVIEPSNLVNPPVIGVLNDVTLRPGESIELTATATDPDGDTVTFWSTTLPMGAELNAATGVLTYTADATAPASYPITIVVTDGALSASTSFIINVNPWPDTDPTLLSGLVLDASDYANNMSTPVSGATVQIGGQTVVTDAAGAFSFILNAPDDLGAQIILIDGSTANTATSGNAYGSTNQSVTVFANAPNALPTPILLNSFAGDELIVSTVSDTLPVGLRSCKIERIENAAGTNIDLANIDLTSEDILAVGTKMSVWGKEQAADNYAIIGTGVIGNDGQSIEQITGSIPSGSTYFVTPIALQGEESPLQPKDSYVPSLLGEGNMQTGFSLPSYLSLGQNRASSFLYNSVAANPNPIITADITIPSSAALTATLEAELYVNGQRVPGVTITDLTQSGSANAALPTEDAQANVSLSVSFDASALPTGAYDYELYVFAGHTCSAAAVKIEGRTFVNNRSQSPYGSGWKPTELQTLITQPDGSIVIEEANGGLTEFKTITEQDGFNRLSLRYDIAGGGIGTVVADFNNDSLLDLAFAEGNNGSVSIYLNRGGETFERTTEIGDLPAVQVPEQGVFFPALTALSVGDVNNDNVLDLLVPVQSVGLFVAFGNGGDNFSNFVKIIDGQFLDAIVADFNDDGISDIATVAANALGIGTPNVYLADGNGEYTEASITAPTFSPLSSRLRIRVLDLDLDGDLDVVGSGAAAFINDGNGNFVYYEWDIVNSTDLLGDIFDVDFIKGFAGPVSFSAYNNTISTAVFNETLQYFEVAQTFEIGSDPAAYLRGQYIDYNGDGKPDIMVGFSTGETYVLLADDNGVFLPPQLVPLGHPIRQVRIADFDGDGANDLLSVNRYDFYVDYGQPNSDDKIISPFGDFSNLEKTPEGNFIRRYKDGTSVEFNDQGKQTAFTDANNNKTSYTYDSFGRLISMVDSTGLVTTNSYNEFGLLSLVVDPAGRETRFEYDNVGNLLKVFFPDGTIQTRAYDEKNLLVEEIDQRNQTTNYSYDNKSGRLLETTGPDGGSVKIEIAKSLGLSQFGVDLGAPSEAKFVAPEERVTQLEDAKGNQAENEVNEWGAVIRTKDPIGRETFYKRNQDNRVTRITTPSSVTNDGELITLLDYDSNANVTRKREAFGTPLQREVTYEYEPVYNRVTRMVDYAGFETVYEYDDRGNLTSQTNPDGTTILQSFDTRGLLTSRTDERGNTTTYTHDTQGRQISITDPVGAVERAVWDIAGNEINTVRAAGTNIEQVIARDFDPMNRLVAETNGEGERTGFSYDGAGNLISKTDPTGVIEQRIYDAKGRVEGVNDSSSGLTETSYDLNDNLTSVTAVDGTQTVMEYDAVNRVTQTVDALGITRMVAYDLRDNIIAVTDGRGNTTTFAYDLLDRVISRTNPVGNTWQFEYDERDLRTATIKPDGTRVYFSYDSLGRFLRSNIREYIYDDAGNVELAFGMQSRASVYTYDERNFLIAAVEDYKGFSVPTRSYEYDELGRRTRMHDDSTGETTLYEYDNADRLIALTLPSGKVINFNYDGAGRRTDVIYPNGLTTRMSYETPVANEPSTGRLSAIIHGLDAANNNQSGATVLNQRLGSFTYNYDVKGNITAINESGTVARARSYTLDALERLTEVTDGVGQALETYTLDEEGNRITSNTSSFHVTDPANRVTENETHVFEYDVNGNLTLKSNKITGETWRYTYNVMDQLLSVKQYDSTDPNAPFTSGKTWDYDGYGRRIIEFDNITGHLRFMHYDGENIAMEYTAVSTFVSEDVFYYTHSDITDELLAVTTPRDDDPYDRGNWSVDDKSNYYHTDHQGSVRAITDDSGAIINEYSYGAYGDTETAVESLKQTFRYTGREYDPDTGLMHYRARTYDPETGRFLQEDPIWFAAGDLNVHRYVWNNPVNWIDPSGLSGSEYGTTGGVGLQAAGGIARVGNSLSCLLATVAGAVEVAGAATNGFQVQDIGTYTEVSGDIIQECGARTTLRRTRTDACTGNQIVEIIRMGAGMAAANIDYLRRLKSFDGSTEVLTKDGFKTIETINVGELVAAIDEKTGTRVWRKVVEKFSHQTKQTVEITVEDAEGNQDKIISTLDHPFHVENWNAEQGGLLASLNGLTDLPAHMVMPSDGATPFGDWVKAGGLKIGDEISTLGSVGAESGPTKLNALKKVVSNDNGKIDLEREITPQDLAALGIQSTRASANDNKPVTIIDIIRNEAAKRVYNFEVESLPGEITHNYMVGDDALWVHNAQRGAGPSGKPKIHIKKYPTRKRAKDAQANKPGAYGAIRHPSPRNGRRHFHPTNRKGCIIKDGSHGEY